MYACDSCSSLRSTNSLTVCRPYLCSSFFFFFFQAEDGIRDHCVTGVQTCALPISFAVEGNTAGGSGGGLHIEGDESLLVKGSLIKQNHASGNGGGLVVQLGANAIGDAVINGSEIANNDSGAGGGGLMLIDASPTKQIVVRGSLITGNRALGDGGGVAADSGNPLLMTSFVMLNVAGDAGGGIADRTESFTIINDRIVSNSAANPLGPGGGGLFSDGPHVVNAG